MYFEHIFVFVSYLNRETHDKPCNMGYIILGQTQIGEDPVRKFTVRRDVTRKNFCRDGRYVLFFHGVPCFHVFHQFWITAIEQQRWERTHRQGILIKTDIGIDVLQLSCRRIRFVVEISPENSPGNYQNWLWKRIFHVFYHNYYTAIVTIVSFLFLSLQLLKKLRSGPEDLEIGICQVVSCKFLRSITEPRPGSQFRTPKNHGQKPPNKVT